MLSYDACRFIGDLTTSEKLETDRFLEECITDPSLRDKMSIINRTFQNRQRVRDIVFQLV